MILLVQHLTDFSNNNKFNRRRKEDFSNHTFKLVINNN